MRRALGLDRETSPASQPTNSPPFNGPHQRRHFARDGDVPVTMVHSDSGSRFQQLDAAREALRQQTAAREEAERLLADARNTIHDLETKLGHERLARDEVRQRIDVERLQFEEALTTVQEELATERALRGRAQRERDEATVATQTAEQRRRTTSKLRSHLRRPSPKTSPRDAAVGLRRSRRRMLHPAIRRLWNGGRQGGRKIPVAARSSDAAATAPGGLPPIQPRAGCPPDVRADASEEEVCLTRKSSRRCDGLAEYRRNLLVRQLFMRRLEQHGPDGSATSLARTRLEQKMAADPRTIRGSPIADQSERPSEYPRLRSRRQHGECSRGSV